MRMLGDHPTLYLVVLTNAQQKSLEKPGFSELFSVSRYSYPRPFRRPKNKRYRLRLLFLLDLQSSPTVLPLSLSHHVETGRPHQKHIVTRTRVSRSKSPDQQTHFCVVLAPAIHFWCRRGESNSRPQCLCYKGITTISLVYNQNGSMSTVS